MSVWYHTNLTRQETIFNENANQNVVIDMNQTNKAFRKKLQSQYAPLFHHNSIGIHNASIANEPSDLKSQFLEKYDFQSKLISPSLIVKK